MNIDKIRMDTLLNKYKDEGKKEFHKIYKKVFSETDLYCIYDEIKLNNLYYSEIVDPIKNEIKKEFVKCFRNYCYYILQDLDNAFKNDKRITDHISMLVGGESMSFYNITNIEDTDDYDIKVFYEGKKENAIQIIYNNLSKYVVLLNNIFPVANIIEKNNRVNLYNDEERSLARLRFIKNICKDYDLFSIDFKIIVKINNNQDINNIAINIPILDVAIVKKNIQNFKNKFTFIAKRYNINKVEDNCTKSVIINITKNITNKRQLSSTNYNEQQNKHRRIVGGGVGDIQEKQIEQIEEYFFINSQDNLLPEEPATQAAQKANTEDYAAAQAAEAAQAAQAAEAAVKEDINTTWNINIPTLLYYIYDYYYMYGKIENKKMRFLAGKTDKDKARYLKIKELLFNKNFNDKKINRDILYDYYFNNFLNYNINPNNYKSAIISYIDVFKNMMLNESYKPKIKMPFKKDPDHMTIGGGENNQYSYFLADLFQNILDSIFFYHKSF